ncbi:hypothetical protein SUGI_0952230 [Cryptomeria japonica]|nr:hypothetical protein SUGI_0952230 [Cryptomeria japonica]
MVEGRYPPILHGGEGGWKFEIPPGGMDEENQSENHCWDSKGLVGMEIQNLKSLEVAKSYGWIEVKHKKGKRGKDGNSCNDTPLEGGDGSGEVAP